jgi:hypothetical protein
VIGRMVDVVDYARITLVQYRMRLTLLLNGSGAAAFPSRPHFVHEPHR